VGWQYESAFARSREAIRTVAHPQIKLTSLIPRAFNSISFNRLIIGLFEWKILRHFYIVIGIIYFKLHNRICAFEYQTIFFSFRINFSSAGKLSTICLALEEVTTTSVKAFTAAVVLTYETTLYPG
jgi:hypothetical protein